MNRAAKARLLSVIHWRGRCHEPMWPKSTCFGCQEYVGGMEAMAIMDIKGRKHFLCDACYGWWEENRLLYLVAEELMK